MQVSALAEIAEAAAAADPDRAAQLIADAERIAKSITANEDMEARALANIVVAVAVIDPDCAERIAQSITYRAS